MWPAPVTLTGQHTTLSPLSLDHLQDLKRATEDGELSKIWYTVVPSADGMKAEIERRLSLQDAGQMLPFAVCTPIGRPVGMTTFMNVDATNRRVEIGSTWYGKSVQRSGLNTDAKRLLLSHAFDTLNCIAVEFRTHVMNRQSRAAIERLGAKLDGVLRSHVLGLNGTLRDTAVYSITAAEWPTVNMNLEGALAKWREAR